MPIQLGIDGVDTVATGDVSISWDLRQAPMKVRTVGARRRPIKLRRNFSGASPST